MTEGPVDGEPLDVAPSAPRWRRWLLWALRVGGTCAAFAYIATVVDLAPLAAALERVSAPALGGAAGLIGASLFVGAVRWWLLLAAYGASEKPSITRLAYVYWVGFFYNTFLPGGVGGDVIRGLVVRRAFTGGGATASVTVVFVERALGLAGLLILVSGAHLVRPLEGTAGVLPYSALGLAFALAGVMSVAVGRRLAPRLPRRIRVFAERLPEVRWTTPFLGALALSLVTQALVALTGWILMDAVVSGGFGVTEAFVLVPLAMAAVYFPLSVGGAGAREAAFVALGTTALGLAEAEALASSLLLWACQLGVAGLGGVAQIFVPASGERASVGDE